MINLPDLPNDVIAIIAHYTDPKSKRALSQVNRRIREVVLDTIKCIRVFPPEAYPSEIPKDILATTISRYPRLQEIIFGPQKNLHGTDEFTTGHAPYLEPFISYLQSNPDEHPLNSVKKIRFREIDRYFLGKAQVGKLNKFFLSSIGHIGLENIKIEVDCNGSVLTGKKIQPVLDNSPNLRTFSFNGFQSNQMVTLSFTKQPLLSKVKLLDWDGDSSTLDSLKNCKRLEELIISYTGVYSTRTKSILLKNHPWNLKRLELHGMALRNDAYLDAITKTLPNLECLNVRLEDISDEGIEKLGKNCPNLKILQFNNSKITDAGLDKLTRHLPHLEIIQFEEAFKITEKGIAAIARNCKKIRFIQVFHYKHIEKSGIEALIENCPNLRGVEFTHGGPISLEDMYQLAQQMPKLRYVNLDYVDGIQEQQIKDFYQTFPHLSKIPYVSSAKQLDRLAAL
ncbi:MAG: hypothetical protein Q8L98_05425 [Chlamydiales bacterium]|nr:hypothetical protein [Chlamydiales bacterium]